MSKREIELGKLRDLSEEELDLALKRAREELFRSRIGLQTNQVQDTGLTKKSRRRVARILTVVAGRKQGLEKRIAAGKDS